MADAGTADAAAIGFQPAARHSFKRTLGALSLLGFTLSAMSPAASLFISGSGVLHLAGTGSAIAIAIGAMLAVIASLLYAEVASGAPHAGGMYAGVSRLLGPWAGFVILCLSVMTAPAYLAFSAAGLSEYLGFLFPSLPGLPIAATAIVASAALAIVDIRVGAAVTSAMLVLELLAIAVLAVVAAGHPVVPVASLAHPVVLAGDGRLIPVGGWQLALASVAGAFACAGALWGSYLGEDVRSDSRAFGRTLAISGLVGALIVAVPLILVVLAMDDPKVLLSAEAPLIALVEQRAGHLWAIAVSAGVSIAIFNNLMSMTIALGRLLLATGRDAIWPDRVSRLLAGTGRFGSPVAATILLAVVALPLLLLPVRMLLIVLSAELFSPMMIALAVLAGRTRRGEAARGFRAPLHPLLPVLGLIAASLFLAATWLDPTAGRPAMILMAAVVIAATLYHHFGRSRA